MLKNINDHIVDSLNIIYYPLIDMASTKKEELSKQCSEMVRAIINYDTTDQLRENIIYHE